MSTLNHNRHGLVFTPFVSGRVNRLENLFDRVFGDESGFASATQNGGSARLPIAVWQDDDRIFVEAEIAGLTESDLEVVVHDGVLHIKGERKAVDDRKYLYNSRSFGKFEREISLPDPVDANLVDAEFKNGILLITLPKSQAARPKKITLKTS